MLFFSQINEIKTLKHEYRKLAAKYHPDRGGDVDLMKIINEQYEIQLEKLNLLIKANIDIAFEDVSIGDTVWVNGTEAEVIKVNQDRFHVVAKGRTRQAVFDKVCGRGLYNPALFASYDYRPRPNCNQ